ncbi:hypothetical protein BFV94_3493 [Alteromonas macleodii]|uniref:Uncharacterized protein n=1 Tax=Alteromonas macleodii TaxID=28108 RepID=A0AB36FTI8_ALTMA|nr:hypothetical protein BFV93_3484 [Alteromonas macleodii]OES28047.1 hypothetical protein BFV94_3493 [Alteromonas macleodii]OES28128.1 hypothetical protein BFV95_3494 [Alteromonas macleodii]OES39810.1 hypothetical protein BFV96_3477 [Alteromonas macleodii]
MRENIPMIISPLKVVLWFPALILSYADRWLPLTEFSSTL